MVKRTTVYFDVKVLKVAKELAKKEGRSMSNYIACLILAAKERDNMIKEV